MVRLIVGLLVVATGLQLGYAQSPLPVDTEVVIETKTKSIRGTIKKSLDAQWIRILELGAKAPTVIPVTAIETIRQVANGEGAEPRIAAEVAADERVEMEPLEITVQVAADGAPAAQVILKANQPVDPAFLEIVLLGIAEADALGGFIKSVPRNKMLLGLPAAVSFSQQLKPLQAGEQRTINVPLKLDPINGRGGVIATVGSQLPAQGEPGLVGPIPVLECAYIVFMAEDGEIESGSTFLDVEIKRLRDRGNAADTETSGSVEEAIERMRRAGARSVKRFAAELPNAEAAAAEETAATRVVGTVKFTDVAGGTHPVPFIKVEVWDANSSAPHQKLADGTTDANGNYQLQFAVNMADRPDLYVISRATGPTVKVVDFNSPASDIVWAIDSLPAVNDVVPGSELRIDITADNDLITRPSNVAFEIYAAVDVMARYVQSIGQPLPRQVRVRYPRAEDGSDYLNDTIRLGGTDAHDWDNIHHEYGHHLQAIFGISNSPGGPHALDENLCQSREKADGIHLAWGEGWPTFFSILMQSQKNLALMNVPNLGDTRYTDTKPSGMSLEYDIENDFDTGGAGEGNEIAVQRILWDLYDSRPGEQEQISVPAANLFQLAKDNHCDSFSAFWNVLMSSRPANDSPVFAPLLTTHRVAPAPQSPAEGSQYSGGPAPTFSWNRAPGCGQAGSTKFQLIIYGDDVSTPRFESGLLTVTSYTPTNTERLQIFGGSNGPLNWVVRVHDQGSPATGKYLGRPRTIIDQFDAP